MEQPKVREFMSRGVEAIRRDKDVHELEKLLLEKKVHGVPVVDEEDRLVGVVSQTDLLSWHFETGVDGASFYDGRSISQAHEDLRGLKIDDVRRARIDEVMSPQVYCISPDRPISEAAAMMIGKWIHRIVVVDEDLRVLGVISAIDLLHALPGTKDAIKRSVLQNV